MARKSEV
ncbi:hypothetical protein Zm00014a_016561 [Zea mays]|nr:hypothetical protein Zm00014a_016561 [Zea mays]